MNLSAATVAAADVAAGGLLPQVRDSERSTRAQLNKLQHMSRSQAMVLRSYANAKLRDALAVLNDADIQDEDQLRRRDVLAEFVENGAFSNVKLDNQDTVSNNSSDKLEELEKENEELRQKLAKKGRKHSVPPPSGPPPDAVERQVSSDASLQVPSSDPRGEQRSTQSFAKHCAAKDELEQQNKALQAKVQELEEGLRTQASMADAGEKAEDAATAAAAASAAEDEKKDKEIRKLKKKIKEIRESQEKEKEELMDCMAQVGPTGSGFGDSPSRD
eukprot:scaffold1087_cov198-Pinguiococcus_pyrenoidosus.AAC.7